MTTPRPIAMLIAALGGEGGGVLTDWIVGAAADAGYPVQSTSIPGVAQRTGATTYYIEILPILSAKAKSYTFKEVYFSPVSSETAVKRLREAKITS